MPTCTLLIHSGPGFPDSAFEVIVSLFLRSRKGGMCVTDSQKSRNTHEAMGESDITAT